MTTPTFADLAQFGIENKPVSEVPDHDALADAFVAAVFDELELDIPEEPTEQDIEDINIILEHAAMGVIATDLEGSEFIAQWGVLGMKWGRRKNRDGKYEYNARRQAGNHPGHGEGGEKLGNENRSKSVREMSDADLQAVINRHRLEQQYNQIMAAKPNALTEFTKTVLKDAAKKQATAYASKALGAVGDVAIKAASKALNDAREKQKASK